MPDPNLLPVCQMDQLPSGNGPMGTLGTDNTCSASPKPGWCYDSGQAAGACPQQILFTANEPPVGSTTNTLCQ
ncbi:MAG: hypothetical protein M3O46_19415 [Myxococcota bacterium]|nr:hypothetical protein [Myxococcota bacterium]